MKVVRFHEYGSADVLKYEDVPEPEPGPGEVRVRAEVIGVGIPDVLVRTATDVKTWPLPMIPGNDMVGTVDALGPDVTRFRKGERVYITSRELPLRGGCYAEARVVPETAPFALPDNVASEDVVHLANFQVAWFLLSHAAQPQEGQSILVHAAAGGVGSALVQLAKRRNLTVCAVAGGPEKTAFVRDMGADAVIDRHAAAIPEAVAEFTRGSGLHVIYDSVGGPDFAQNFDMLRPFGKVVTFGFVAGHPDPAIYEPMARDFSRNLGFQIFSIHYFDDKPELRRPVMEQLIGMLADGEIKPRLHARLPLADAAEAHRMLESGEVLGKIVLTP
ncbi:MAG: zinc-dependent alcohol dehydrogenase family protein [Alphaproteobacteria bacterium]|nr:zinc-dependent alcohol dehydrogenase family protein [Alphaproteobacteria bacterium]